MRTPEFPKEIKRGSVGVTIYNTPSKGYEHYTLVYYEQGARKREYNSDMTAIVNRANEVLDDLSEGRPTQAGALKTSERTEFVRAKAFLRKVSAITKVEVPLDVAARHYAESVRILGSDLVIEAAREYAKRHPVKMPVKLVAEVVTEFLDEKEKQGRSERHRETLKSHCKRFGDSVCMNIGSVTAADVDLFLDGLEVGARTRDNIANSIRTLFEFAKRKRYLAETIRAESWQSLAAQQALCPQLASDGRHCARLAPHARTGHRTGERSSGNEQGWAMDRAGGSGAFDKPERHAIANGGQGAGRDLD